jgi:hypothetical protein
VTPWGEREEREERRTRKKNEGSRRRAKRLVSLFLHPRRGTGHSAGVLAANSLHPLFPRILASWSRVFFFESPTTIAVMAATPAAAAAARATAEEEPSFPPSAPAPAFAEASSAGAPAAAVPHQNSTSPSRLGCLQIL